MRSHSERLYIAQSLGAQPWITIATMVVCKRHLTARLPSEDHAYLFTLRFLLERLSWLARDRATTLTYTLALITRFSMPKLRTYEAKLLTQPGCQIHWTALDPHGGYIDQPQRNELLPPACGSVRVSHISRVRARPVRKHGTALRPVPGPSPLPSGRWPDHVLWDEDASVERHNKSRLPVGGGLVRSVSTGYTALQVGAAVSSGRRPSTRVQSTSKCLRRTSE